MKNRRNVGTAVAVVLLLTITPLAWKTYSNKLDTKELATNTNQEEIKEDNKVKEEVIIKEQKLMDRYKAVKPLFKIENAVKFKSTIMDKAPDIKFGTAWKDIRNTNYEYSIDGKGPEVSEEGVAELIVKDKKNNKFKIFQVNDEKLQKSPLKVIGGYENYALVIVGNAHGTIAYGGDLYVFNLDEETSAMIYTKNNDREQIVDGNIEGSSLNLKILKFKDDSLNKFDTYEEKIEVEDIKEGYSDQDKQKQEGLIGKLGKKAGSNDEQFKELFMGGYDKYHKQYLGESKDIQSIASYKIIKLKKFPYSEALDNLVSFDHKVYIVESLYKTKDGAKIKDRINYQIILVGRASEELPWKVVDIISAP